MCQIRLPGCISRVSAPRLAALQFQGEHPHPTGGCRRRCHLFWVNFLSATKNLTELLPDFPGVSFADLALRKRLSPIMCKGRGPPAGPRLPRTCPACERPRLLLPQPWWVLEVGRGKLRSQADPPYSLSSCYTTALRNMLNT